MLLDDRSLLLISFAVFFFSFRFVNFNPKFACCCSRVILHSLFSLVLVVVVGFFQPSSISRSLHYLLLPSFALANVQAATVVVVVVFLFLLDSFVFCIISHSNEKFLRKFLRPSPVVAAVFALFHLTDNLIGSLHLLLLLLLFLLLLLLLQPRNYI